MSKFRNICWWLFFMAAAIGLQALTPGLDALAVGIIILLQERDYKNMLWLLPLFVLLQEGMGTRVFGGVIVWYAAIIVLFKLGRWLFEVENFIFIFLLSSCLGAAYYGVAWLMAPLQDIPFNVQDTLDKSLIQALFLPFAWRLLIATRHWTMYDEEK
ncbi:hypothetical protein [uncultured Desulfovibrio sp.]|jgi:hypothetical protein|uniref:hypothetical protein n=1 Tax=uncultured Desulfovibrio sp. TaxID=167968 RepID=UPI00263A06F2|nr:hypothetical protein [uncultured Desulfovibrio sp.]